MVKEMSWHKHYPAEIPRSIEYDKKPLHAYLEDSAKEFPEMKALHFMGNEISYKELFKQSKQMANYLQSLGLKTGDRVAIMLPNTPQAVISYYGALMAGGIVVQTNPLYTPRELRYQMQDSGANFMICLDILLPRVQQIQSETDLQQVIIAEIKDYLPFPKNFIYPFMQKKQYGFSVNVE